MSISGGYHGITAYTLLGLFDTKNSVWARHKRTLFSSLQTHDVSRINQYMEHDFETSAETSRNLEDFKVRSLKEARFMEQQSR